MTVRRVSAELATKYRAAVARVVYLAQDRLDLGVAAPWQFREEGHDERLKRVAPCLHGHPDDIQWYTVQEDTNTVVLTTHVDWATCQESL